MTPKPANDRHGLRMVDGAPVWATTRDGQARAYPLAAMTDVHLLHVHRFSLQHGHPPQDVAVLLDALTARGLAPLPCKPSLDEVPHAR